MTTSAGRDDAGRRPVRVDFGVASVDVVTADEAVDAVVELARRPGVDVVVTPNLDHLALLRSQRAMQLTYRRAALVLADGMPLVLVARLLRLPLRQRVAGSDLALPLLAACAKAGVGVFFFGATDAVNEAARNRLTASIPELRVVGQASPRYVPGRPDRAMAESLDAIRASGARLVLVGFGAPKQETLLHEYADRLPDACYLCCGATLDFLAGRISRAPRWMSRTGLEWLYRLAKEPGRLWKRYLVRDLSALPILARMAVRRVRGDQLVST